MVGDSGDWGGSSNANIIPLDTIKYYGRGKIPTKSLPQPCTAQSKLRSDCFRFACVLIR